MWWYFFFFFVSGCCSVLYEVIWLRLAMAQYGVTTPLVSLVLSTFMLGLGLGSWGAGRLVKNWGWRSLSPLRLYSLTELAIGFSALVVPIELSWGRLLLDRLAVNGLSSTSYYFAAGAWIAICLVPWCACMGATFPFAMFAIEAECSGEHSASFSYLYLANVLGAVLGASAPLLLIEVFGFRETLHISSILNFSLATAAIVLSLRAKRRGYHRPQDGAATVSGPSSIAATADAKSLLWLLFATGLTSMGAEVVWVRMFTPWLGTVVYAFASILVLYLGATYVGSLVYRTRVVRLVRYVSLAWAVLGFTVVLPLIAADPRLSLGRLSRVAIGVVPFSAVLGFVTPLMVDRISSGDGERAGRAYAVNVVGCILGPLLAGFLLLPSLGERLSLSLLALPWFAIALLRAKSPLLLQGKTPSIRWIGAVLALAGIVMLVFTKGFEDQFPKHLVRRDYMATVVASGDSRPEKRLLVNGVGMTGLVPITKMMAHLPLAMLGRKPTNILIICFGMGTSYRSALSWGISSTAIELVPSVPEVYGYFHDDGPRLLQSPQSHLIIDDGRLFLERTSELYDVITIDPPPPVEAAGSSLLYSKEFYTLVKRHLRAGGIVQQWLPYGDPTVLSSVTKALQQSFPNVRLFKSITDYGFHFLASVYPIADTSANALASRMPAAAVRDMLEWGPESTPEAQFSAALSKEMSLGDMTKTCPNAPPIEDDRPINEYYYLRSHHPAASRRLYPTGSLGDSERSSQRNSLAPQD